MASATDLVIAPHIANAVCVTSFDRDVDVRLRQREIESAFRTVVTGQSIATNVPDQEIPPIPRFLMKSGEKQLSISQVSAQLELTFPPESAKPSNTVEQRLQIVERNAREFFSALLKFKKADELKESGIVVTLNYPAKVEIGTLQRYVFDRFFKMPPKGQVVSAGMQVGFAVDPNLYLNFSVGCYEWRQVMLSQFPAAKQPNAVNVLESPVTGIGIEVKIDLNDRPAVIAGTRKASTTDALIARVRSAVISEANELLGVMNG